MAFVVGGGCAGIAARASSWTGGTRGKERRDAAVARGCSRVLRMDVSPPTEASMKNLVTADAEKVLNVGIIGAGRIGQVHADTISFRLKNAKLAGVASGTKQLADRCSLEHGCKPYYDYHDLLENPEVDAVCICSASNQHTKQIIEAAEAGKHIFCEKPIDTELEVIDKALSAVKKAGVKLQVGFNRRFDTNYRRIKTAVTEGEIGKPHMIHITSRDPSPPPLEYVKSSGGIWLDCSIHDFDMARFLIGDEVEEVYALGATNINPDFAQYGDIDTSLVTLRFKNGVLGTVDNSRQAVYGYDQRCEVFGSEGNVETSNNYGNSAVISNNKKIQRDLPLHFFMDRYTDSFVVELQEFCDVVLNDAPIPCTGIDGRAPVVIALAAKKSYNEGRPVKLSEVDIELPEELKGWDGQA
mmetsp:Transcript_6927/g.14781  ORF Transcript_6927/g.14781 Transcript_6927/m.14781 type:complete len:412 (+) Transcript_6927:101-1336(+)|eukprot:CAMPEP_0185858148 /NCGR_PEP_ID=MMETSP1354-20130828/29865_1 /TAXON_ID=708628 /ORGANISM="Erythrolobus madagascarensis, Strain CCMP3276" /LENGTH=411 /DNA_ID=CAMNT_0028560429 /DNA_START=82 /DNA_END=1317 /DNA_ORIENTATION=+